MKMNAYMNIHVSMLRNRMYLFPLHKWVCKYVPYMYNCAVCT
jgi:hypothetical protein